MAGDGIRKNIASLSANERDHFKDVIVQLHQRHYPGSRSDNPPGGVSFWFKQDEIHQATHVHGTPAFLPWHRELCNYFERLMREIDPDISLHYWDWSTDPHPLFTPTFMGNANGDAGEPWLSAGFYNPSADPYRADDPFDLAHANPYDPPRSLTRDLPAGGPPSGTAFWPADTEILAQPTYPLMWAKIKQTHDQVHSAYIRGTIGNSHASFRDPFVFLLHSNVDRLFAMWQTTAGQAWRLDPAQVYGSDATSPQIIELLEPWAGASTIKVRPWAAPENRQVSKNSQDISVVMPPCYDTMPGVPASVALNTPGLNFTDIPVGEKTVRAVNFSVYACQRVTFRVTDGPRRLTGSAATSFELPLGDTVVVDHGAGYSAPEARLWIAFQGTAAGDAATGTVTVHCQETGQDFVVSLTTNTVARPRAAVALVLDQSGSMSEDGGDGRSRLQVLKDSASVFAAKLQQNNAVGIVSFDQDPHDILPITVVGAPDDAVDPQREAVRNAIDAFTNNPAGSTAIGDGVERGNALLLPVSSSDFAVKAMIVLTDGQETDSKYISDVTSIINPNHHIFAIGVGTPEQIQPAALSALAHGHRGTLSMTGVLDQNDRYLLTKFYLQILADITDEAVVTDPQGYALPGQKYRIAFTLNEADMSSDVVLLSDAPQVFRFSLETPDGQTIDTANVAGVPGSVYVPARDIHYYRVNLPALLGGRPAQEGTWQAVLEIEPRLFKRYLASLEKDQTLELYRQTQTHGVRYNLTVQAYSSLRLGATLSQNSLEPGATLTLRGRLSEYDLPVERRAQVQADLTRPDGSQVTLTLAETEPGIFETQLTASLSGLYAFRVRAAGVTLRGYDFTRERLLSGVVWQGGDRPPPTTGVDPHGRDERLCRMLECMLSEPALGRFLAKQEIDARILAKCLKILCD